MAIRYTCSCGNIITLPNGTAGRRARCRSCGAVFSIPPVQDEPMPLAYASASLAVDAVVEDTPGAVPARSFLSELFECTVFFLNARNLMAWVSLTLAVIVANRLPFMFGVLGWIMDMYLAAFALSTVLETASGARELPDVWVHNFWEDLFLPFIQFVGTWLMALLPLLVTLLTAYGKGVTLPDSAIYGLITLGILLWPAIVLIVAVGGTLSAARPDLVLRTMAASPVAYLAVSLVVGCAVAIWLTPESLLISILGIRGPGSVLAAAIIEPAAGLYATILSARAVGLYYRHYKERLPWSAE